MDMLPYPATLSSVTSRGPELPGVMTLLLTEMGDQGCHLRSVCYGQGLC